MNAAALIVGTTLLATVVHKGVDLVKFLTNKDFNGFITQVGAYLVGIGATFLVAATQFSSSIPISDTQNLGALDSPSKIVVGIMVASGAGTIVDFKQARDNNDSAVKPSLIPQPPAPPQI